MKKALLSLALLLVSSTAASAQNHANSTSSPKKAVTISGQLSADGKTLVGENDDIWTISNPGVLVGREGQPITVKCQLSSDKSSIHVFFVKAGITEAKYVAKNSDSAFRR
jgi:hypothetical protein